MSIRYAEDNDEVYNKKDQLEIGDYTEFYYKRTVLGKRTGKPCNGSIKNVFWKCKQGHSWESSPNKRTAKGGSNCPYCVNKKVWKGYNDLASINPNIVQEWDYENMIFFQRKF